jgi:hypothetical protein
MSRAVGHKREQGFCALAALGFPAWTRAPSANFQDVVRRLHGCEFRYVESVPILEEFQGPDESANVAVDGLDPETALAVDPRGAGGPAKPALSS